MLCFAVVAFLIEWYLFSVYQQNDWENIYALKNKKEYLWTQVQEFISIQENIILGVRYKDEWEIWSNISDMPGLAHLYRKNGDG